MNKKLTQQLVQRFPVLYQDYTSPMTQTCMCWGFDHGDGWFEIIWQLSLAIEAELNYSWLQRRSFLFKKSFFRRWNAYIYRLSPAEPARRVREGSGTSEDPYRWVIIEEEHGDWLARAAAKLFAEEHSGNLRSWRGKLRRLGFKAFVRWQSTGLAVQQVKEKYGTLRFYCDDTEAIRRYIQLAERLSSITCEQCGKRGTANHSGWIQTLCKGCRTTGES